MPAHRLDNRRYSTGRGGPTRRRRGRRVDAGRRQAATRTPVGIDARRRELARLSMADTAPIPTVPEPGARRRRSGPVFVDATGRRRRLVRRFALSGSCLLGCALFLLIAAMFGADVRSPLVSLPRTPVPPPPSVPPSAVVPSPAPTAASDESRPSTTAPEPVMTATGRVTTTTNPPEISVTTGMPVSTTPTAGTPTQPPREHPSRPGQQR